MVLRDPTDRGYSVKRIVGVEGDVISLNQGQVEMNGHMLKEAYLPPETPTYPDPKLRQQQIRCGKNEFIVLGDNRMNSMDSRHYGPISRRDILGLIIR